MLLPVRLKLVKHRPLLAVFLRRRYLTAVACHWELHASRIFSIPLRLLFDDMHVVWLRRSSKKCLAHALEHTCWFFDWDLVYSDFNLHTVHIVIRLLGCSKTIVALDMLHGHDTLLQALNFVMGYPVSLVKPTRIESVSAELIHEELVAKLFTWVAILSHVALILSRSANHLLLFSLFRFSSHLDFGHALVEIEFLSCCRSRADPCTPSKVLLLCRGGLLNPCERCNLQPEVLFTKPSVMVWAEMLNECH